MPIDLIKWIRKAGNPPNCRSSDPGGIFDEETSFISSHISHHDSLARYECTASDTMTEIKAHLNHGINIELNGQPWQPEKTPITYDSSTYLPLRAVGEALGAQITWDGSTRTVSIVTDGAPPAEERAVRDAQETEQQPADDEVYYRSCAEAREAGAAPIHIGDPGYGRHLDRDGDGIACE